MIRHCTLDYTTNHEIYTLSYTTLFRSDGRMRRRIRREYTWRSGIWNFQSEIRYVYDGNLVIEERDANSLPTVAYTRGKDLRSEEHTSELQSRGHLVCRLLLEKKNLISR